MKYTCYKCSKEFDKKSNYEYHIRRIRPCMKIENKIIDEIQTNNMEKILSHTNTTLSHTNTTQIPNLAKNEKDITINIDDSKKLMCNFSRKDALNRHIKTYCKKKSDDTNKEINIYEQLNKLIVENQLLKLVKLGLLKN
jgi:hypothetical protein